MNKKYSDSNNPICDCGYELEELIKEITDEDWKQIEFKIKDIYRGDDVECKRNRYDLRIMEMGIFFIYIMGRLAKLSFLVTIIFIVLFAWVSIMEMWSNQ